MLESKKFLSLIDEHQGLPIAFVFYDRFTRKFGPLNVAGSINEVVFNACNYLKSVEDKNISLEHIDVYIAGVAIVERCEYNLKEEPVLFFNGSEYSYAYNILLEQV